MKTKKRPGEFYDCLTRAHRYRGLDGLAQAGLLWLTFLLATIVALFGVDNLFNLGWRLRAALAIAFASANLVFFARLLARWAGRKLDPRQVAVDLEKTYGVADNCLINAIEFADETSLDSELKRYFAQQATARSAAFDMRRLWHWAGLKKLTRALAATLAVFMLYLAFFGRHAGNALTRYLDPRTSVTPLNYTQFEVSPGDIRLPQGKDCRIVARAMKRGRPATRLDLLVRPQNGTAVLYQMQAQGDTSVFELAGLDEDCDYRIRNRGDLSKWFRIGVARRPQIEDLTIEIDPPAYSGRETYRLSPYERQAGVLRGSRIRINPNCRRGDRPRFTLDGENVPSEIPLSFEAGKTLRATLDVVDRHALLHEAVWSCVFEALADQPPTVRFLNRELNRRLAIGQSLEIQVAANDDCGIRGIELFTLVGEREVSLKHWQFEHLLQERREVAFITVDPHIFAVNSTYRIWARAVDNFTPEQAGRTALPLTLHVTDPTRTVTTAAETDDYARIFALLHEALSRQKSLQTETAGTVNRAARDDLVDRLRGRQRNLHARIGKAGDLARGLAEAGRIQTELPDAIAILVNGAAQRVLTLFDDARAENDPDRRPMAINEIALEQMQVVRILQRILGEIGRVREAEQRNEERLNAENAEKELFARLEKLREDVADYREGSRELLDKLETIDQREPEDWTTAEEELLGQLAARQNDLAHFFRAAFNDLSKLQNQDFSNSMLAEELIELYEELQRSGEALEAGKREIATLAEQMGVELATSIETNIERWLADQKDTIKWNAEEGGDFPDVPLQDLPAELVDIIGDLIDDLEEMAEFEDSTNSYLGSFDEGIGWGVSDGTIDDMSAKGITGNAMPNDNEVGGRAGEGRSGKSSGQFVEETATGKGGRDTPTRLTHSPFEQGTIDDSSTDPQGGATGGGKQSGVGGEGLRGITPDQDPDIAQRLNANQIELKQQAEALMRTLTVHNLPTGDLESAIAAMQRIERRPARAPGLDVRQVRNDVVSSLRDAKAAVAAAANSTSSPTRRQGASAEWNVKFHSDETIPPGYESAVEAYFRSLAK